MKMAPLTEPSPQSSRAMAPTPGEPVPLATRAYWDDWYASKLADEADVPGEALEFEWLDGVGGDGDENDEKVGAMWSVIASMPRSSKVLELGCGVSRLAERMCDAGFAHVDAVDFSESPIAIMNARAACRDAGEMQNSAQNSTENKTKRNSAAYAVADVLHLDRTKYPPETYHLITDKGLMDVILNAHDQEVWFERCQLERKKDTDDASLPGKNIPEKIKSVCPYDGEASRSNAQTALATIASLLKPNGVFVVLSYEPPAGRNEFFTNHKFGWQMKPGFLREDGSGNFIYILEKLSVDEKASVRN